VARKRAAGGNVDEELKWILENAWRYAEGGYGHHVLVIKDRKVIFRVEGDLETALLASFGVPAPEEAQKRDTRKALQWVKERFGDPELIRIYTSDDGENIAVLRYKNGLVLYVYGFTVIAPCC